MKKSNIILAGILGAFFFLVVIHPAFIARYISTEEYQKMFSTGASRLDNPLPKYSRLSLGNEAFDKLVIQRNTDGAYRYFYADVKIKLIRDSKAGIKIPDEARKDIMVSVINSALTITFKKPVFINDTLLIYAPAVHSVTTRNVSSVVIVNASMQNPLSVKLEDGASIQLFDQASQKLLIDCAAKTTCNLAQKVLAPIAVTLKNGAKFTGSQLVCDSLTVTGEPTSRLEFSDSKVYRAINMKEIVTPPVIDHLILKGNLGSLDVIKATIGQISGKLSPQTEVIAKVSQLKSILP